MNRKSGMFSAVFLLIPALLLLVSSCSIIFKDLVTKPQITTHELEYYLDTTTNTGSFDQVTITWSEAKRAGYYDVQLIDRDSTAVWDFDRTEDNDTSFTDHGEKLGPDKFQPGKRYAYRVRGYSDFLDEEGPWSDDYDIRIPAFMPPWEVFPDIGTSGEITLSWAAQDLEDLSYVIRRGTDGEFGSFTQLAEVSGNSYSDDSVIAEQVYYYRVSAKHPEYGETPYFALQASAQ
ncbi:fibronectin type III domain-containing protein [Salinispira pacifica]|uniref:Fibronectin type-III domain-containing protein n=1 Tax=Salinispira pacifica TaxID=1307761 RepID=V5WD10_9SPIO|nr:fibronectin type III domain-containing protein [Salinispira pacifica]AHC13677.1 hypothetical protein L21SP2_0235 [Salinispira pacifica]